MTFSISKTPKYTNMKKYFSIMTVIAIIAVVIVACKDNFNESDFLKLQSQLKSKQTLPALARQLKTT